MTTVEDPPLILRDSANNVKRMLTVLNELDVEPGIKEEYELIKIAMLFRQILRRFEHLTNTPISAQLGLPVVALILPAPIAQRQVRPPERCNYNWKCWFLSWATGSAFIPDSRWSRCDRYGLPSWGIPRRWLMNAATKCCSSTRRHLDKAKELIDKLDTIQPQVLIEAIIIDVALGDDKTFGVSLRETGRQKCPIGDCEGRWLRPWAAGFTDTSISGATSGFNYWGFLGSTGRLP